VYCSVTAPSATVTTSADPPPLWVRSNNHAFDVPTVALADVAGNVKLVWGVPIHVTWQFGFVEL
jgi:hypothetical protein